MIVLIGKVVCAAFALAVMALAAAAFNVRFLAWRRNPLLGPSLRLMDIFNLQAKMAWSALAGSSSAFDRRMVAARNALNGADFRRAHNRVFLAPHCMRDAACPAQSTQYGIQCVRCGKCKLGLIKEACDRNSYRLFILSGSAFVKKLVLETKPDGILLLACPYEANKVMRHLRGFATRGLLLTRDGCVGTDADVAEVTREIGGEGGKTETRESGNVGT